LEAAGHQEPDMDGVTPDAAAAPDDAGRTATADDGQGQANLGDF
jgi:hypothetical protein